MSYPLRNIFAQLALAGALGGCVHAQQTSELVEPPGHSDSIMSSGVMPTVRADMAKGYDPRCRNTVEFAQMKGEWLTKEQAIINCDRRWNAPLPRDLVSAAVREEIEADLAWHRAGLAAVKRCEELTAQDKPRNISCPRASAWQRSFATQDALERAIYRAEQPEPAFKP